MESRGAERSKFAHKLSRYFSSRSIGNRSAKENLFNSLPDELLGSILEYVDLKSFIRAGQIDTRFNRISHDRVFRNHAIDQNLEGVSQFVKLSINDMKDLRDDFLLSYPHRSYSEETLVEFEISKTPVSQLLYVTFMGANPSKRKERMDCEDSFIQTKVRGKKVTLCPDLPIENVSWNEIQTFLERFNRLVTSKGYQYTISSRLQHNFAVLGLVSNRRNPEDPRWKAFENFYGALHEWAFENDGKIPIGPEQKNRPIPSYFYATGFFGTSYMLTRAAADFVLNAGKSPEVPYFPITFRLVRNPI